MKNMQVSPLRTRLKIHMTSIASVLLCCCNGPRNLYSSLPYVSPVPMQKNEHFVEVSDFTNTKSFPGNDSIVNSDVGYRITVAGMPRSWLMVYASGNIKKEASRFGKGMYSGLDFDSSTILTNRYGGGVGLTVFPPSVGHFFPSLSALTSFQQMKLNDKGLFNGQPYQRYYALKQISIGVQANFLLKIGQRFDLAYIMRFTSVFGLGSKTNYSTTEKFDLGLWKDKTNQNLISVIGLYLDYKFVRHLPLYLSAQWYNDWIYWEHFMAPGDEGRVYAKGTGGALGLKLVFGNKRR